MTSDQTVKNIGPHLLTPPPPRERFSATYTPTPWCFRPTSASASLVPPHPPHRVATLPLEGPLRAAEHRKGQGWRCYLPHLGAGNGDSWHIQAGSIMRCWVDGRQGPSVSRDQLPQSPWDPEQLSQPAV